MNKKQLYESIMRSVSREVKKALNENSNSEYYVWLKNHMDADTSGIDAEEVRAYQKGWCKGGPYLSLDNAIMEFDKIIKKELANDSWEYSDLLDIDDNGNLIDFNDNIVNLKNETDCFILAKNYADEARFSPNHMTFTYRPHRGMNTMEYSIITKAEFNRRGGYDA